MVTTKNKAMSNGQISAIEEHHKRNDGLPFDGSIIEKIKINRSAVERRAATISTRRSVKKQWQAAWLLKAISCIDLTTLAGDDTRGKVIRLCAKAKNPVRPDILRDRKSVV